MCLNGVARVQKFDVNGTYLLQIGQYGSGSGQLSTPVGIIVHNDKVFVAEYSNSRVSVFHLDGQFSHIIGSGYVSNPNDVAITSNDQLLVANYSNNSVVRFTLDGTYVDRFGNGHLCNPTVLAVDLRGLILVCEIGNHHISVFDKDGVFVHSFGSNGSAEGQFSSPYGITISPNNDMYVADHRNKRIQIF